MPATARIDVAGTDIGAGAPEWSQRGRPIVRLDMERRADAERSLELVDAGRARLDQQRISRAAAVSGSRRRPAGRT